MPKRISLTEIKRKLSALDIKEDELDVLFNRSEPEIRKFWKTYKTTKNITEAVTDAGEPAEEEDDYDLNAADLKSLEEHRDNEKKAKEHERKAKTKQAVEAAPHEVEAELPETDKLTPEELRAAMDALEEPEVEVVKNTKKK